MGQLSFIQALKIKAFTLFKVPLIGSCSPKIIDISKERVEIKIPHKRKTKNHVNSIYFGALAIGADMSIGLLATHHIDLSGQRITLLFKDFKINFLKRAMGDAHFICEEGNLIEELVQKTIQTKDRQNKTIKGYAVCPQISDEKVCEFELTLSLKQKS